MKTVSCWLCVAIVCLFDVGSFAAEFYQYVNEDGVVIYTDDASKIPTDQRESAGRIKSVESKTPSTLPADAVGGEVKESEGPQSDPEALAAELEGLKTMRTELDAEYAKISAELQRLNTLSQTVKGKKSIREYNEQVDALNQRSRAYQERQQQYVQMVEAYNQKVAPPSKE